MQYHIDTNILLFLIREPDSISAEVYDIVTDYSNTIYTSTVCVMEAIQIILKTNESKKKSIEPSSIISIVKSLNIKISTVTEKHLQVYAAMPVLHTDPNDRLIIAQAAADKMTLISSDLKFAQYAKKMKDFKFLPNKR